MADPKAKLNSIASKFEAAMAKKKAGAPPAPAHPMHGKPCPMCGASPAQQAASQAGPPQADPDHDGD